MRTAAHGDPSILISAIEYSLKGFQELLIEYKIMSEAMEALIKTAEERRLGRISDIKVGPISFVDGQKIVATVTGATGTYQTHIRILPRRGHQCTCPDWVKNGRTVGPCKHVLALGTLFRDEHLVPVLLKINNGLRTLLTQGGVD